MMLDALLKSFGASKGQRFLPVAQDEDSTAVSPAEKSSGRPRADRSKVFTFLTGLLLGLVTMYIAQIFSTTETTSISTGNVGRSKCSIFFVLVFVN